MDSGLSEKIGSLLADPAAVEKIAAVAKTLGLQSGDNVGNASEPVRSGQTDTVVSPPAAITGDGVDIRRARLLAALRPMLRQEKRGKLDAMTRAMTVAGLFSGIKRGQSS